MKYLLLEHWTDLSEVYPAVHVFNTPEEREGKTIELIFGEGELSFHHCDEAARHLQKLKRTGSIEFEGDPGLSWITCENLILPTT